jgi:VIT1/CCC1 family predicted Fe2+/Mn2+ transporter
MTEPDRTDEIRARQRSRALVTALILAGFAVLFFLVTIAKIRGLNP